MPFIVDLHVAQSQHPEFKFIKPLTPSEQKAAFHVQNADGRDLCLKIIAPTYEIDRLQREIEAMHRIAHPNVVTLVEYTFSTSPGASRHFIVEEYIAGSDLAAKMGRAWSRDLASRVFSQLFDGLEQLNLNHIVHRDLKPTNIRVRPNDSPVVIDFGLSRHLSLPDLTATPVGGRIGTPKYFSPEQFQGTKHDIDHRTDLFAVGVMLYEALCARHPFWASGISWPELHDRVCSGRDHLLAPEFLSLPPRWQIVISKLLEKQRVCRINSASQAASLLRKLENV